VDQFWLSGKSNQTYCSMSTRWRWAISSVGFILSINEQSRM